MTSGAIKVFNVNSGVHIKDVSGKEDTDSEAEEGDENDDLISLKSGKSKNSEEEEEDLNTLEIADMKLIWEDDYIMMVACDQ